MNVMILLMSGFENFISIVGIIVMMIVVVGGFLWLMEKFAGVKAVSKFDSPQQTYAQSLEAKTFLESEDPHLVDEAIIRCRKKHFALTHENVWSEVLKIRKESKKNALVEKNKSLVTDNSSNKLDKLQKLSKLKDEGVISEQEFNSLKEEIINK